MVPLAPKLKVITYHFISYRRKSVLNLVEIQNTFVVVLSPGCPQLPEIQNIHIFWISNRLSQCCKPSTNQVPPLRIINSMDRPSITYGRARNRLIENSNSFTIHILLKYSDCNLGTSVSTKNCLALIV